MSHTSQTLRRLVANDDRPRAGGRGSWAALTLLMVWTATPAAAQVAPPGSPLDGWDLTAPPNPAAPSPDGNTTVVPRAAETEVVKPGEKPIQLIALLTDDGQRIEQGIVWRIYEETNLTERRGKLILTDRGPSPMLSLKPGTYIVNAAFGRAHLTRKIAVDDAPAPEPKVEKFVLNAGGLRVTALLGGKPAPKGTVAYSILTDRDQTDERRVVLQDTKPGLVVRLNAGIYHIVSTYGDANAVVRSDVTVEAGKLTEAQIQHAFAKVSFKLVERSDGEALPDTQWTIQTPQGGVVKESVGALPAHTLAPGTYTVIARNQKRAFRRDFIVQDGQTAEVELVAQ